MGTNVSTTDLKARMEAMEEMVTGKKPAADTSAIEKLKAEDYLKAFWNHMHTGEIVNELKEGSDGKGGYLVPPTVEKKLVEGLKNENIFRKISTIVETDHDLRIPVAFSDAVGDWIEEGGEITFTDTAFGQVKLSAHKLYVALLVSEELLDDAGVDLEEYINKIFSEAIGETEEEAFVSGDGNGKPNGILNQAEEGVVSSVDGSLTMDDVVSLIHSVKAPYRKEGVLVMSEDAYTTLQKLKFYDGKPAWRSSMVEGEPETLLGCKVYVSDFMPPVESGNKPILFGDFKYYWIGDRGKRKMKRLSERYADQGLVGFVASQRMDAVLVVPEAVKTMTIK